MSSFNDSPQPLASVKWWRIYWFQGMINDVKRRAPYYVSDFTDAWDYRIVPSTSEHPPPLLVVMSMNRYTDDVVQFTCTLQSESLFFFFASLLFLLFSSLVKLTPTSTTGTDY